MLSDYEAELRKQHSKSIMTNAQAYQKPGWHIAVHDGEYPYFEKRNSEGQVIIRTIPDKLRNCFFKDKEKLLKLLKVK